MKNKIAAACVALSFALALTGCGSPEPSIDGTPIEVFYVAAVETGSPVLKSETAHCPDTEDVLDFALKKLLSQPGGQGLRRAFPDGVETLSAYVNDSIAYVDFTKQYGGLGGISLTMANACLTLTLTSLDGVDGVSVLCDGVPVVQHGVPVMRAQDFMYTSLSADASERVFTRYFSDQAGRYPMPETRPILPREGQSLEWCLMEELLAGPKSRYLYPVMPSETELISVSTEAKVCTVDFSGKFISAAPGNIRSARLTVACIVGTLTELPSVTSVRILVDGEQLQRYYGVDVSQALKRDAFLSGRGSGAGADAALFYPDRDGLGLTPVYLWIEQGEEGLYSREYAALENLFSLSPPAGLAPVCSPMIRIIDLRKSGKNYYLDLSSAFAKTAPPCDPELTLQAIAHTLAQFDSGATVTLSVDGKALSAYFTVEISGPVTADAGSLWP